MGGEHALACPFVCESAYVRVGMSKRETEGRAEGGARLCACVCACVRTFGDEEEASRPEGGAGARGVHARACARVRASLRARVRVRARGLRTCREGEQDGRRG
jgi:hypothetical protein